MGETTDWKNLRNNLKKPKDRIERIESTVTGMFDINYCIGGVEGWIELKSPLEPARDTTKLMASKHNVSIDQANWAMTQLAAGGRAYFMISTNKRWILIHGMHADNINKMTVSELLEIALWHAPKPVRDKDLWTKLRKTLTTKV